MNRKVALITAAGKGSPIGFSIARAFTSAGYDLVITGRNKGRLKEAAKELAGEYDVEVLPVVLDVIEGSLEQSVQRLVEQTQETYGRLDVLVNASQAAKVGDLLQSTKLKDLELSLKTGLLPAYLLMQACYPMLSESHGTVINLTSAGAAAGQPGMAVLAASKEGLRGISAVTANEWAEDGISVCCMEPEVRTSAFGKWALEYPQSAEKFVELESLESFAERCVALVA